MMECNPIWRKGDGNFGEPIIRCATCGTFKGRPCRLAASTAATQPEQANIPALPGCLADRLYEAISIAYHRASYAGSTTRMQKWEATRADLRAALAIPASTVPKESK